MRKNPYDISCSEFSSASSSDISSSDSEQDELPNLDELLNSPMVSESEEKSLCSFASPQDDEDDPPFPFLLIKLFRIFFNSIRFVKNRTLSILFSLFIGTTFCLCHFELSIAVLAVLSTWFCSESISFLRFNNLKKTPEKNRSSLNALNEKCDFYYDAGNKAEESNIDYLKDFFRAPFSILPPQVSLLSHAYQLGRKEGSLKQDTMPEHALASLLTIRKNLSP